MDKMETESANPAADFSTFPAASTASTPTFNPTDAASNIPNSILVRQLQQLAEQQSTSSLGQASDASRCAFTTVPESCVFGASTVSMANQSSSALSRPPLGAARPIRSQRQPMKDITTLEDPNELEQFMAQGEEACISDMKKFITQYSLRQTTVAQMTGVSQPYISKLLNGNHRELSLRCRRNIYAWYLNCRRHPAMYCQDPTTRLETNGDGELVPQRRERYVFRPVLIRMLEQFFAESPFPDGNKRSEIAQACNTALQAEKRVILGGQLMPKEVVTPQVIANWFANKRKEMRRKSNEENRSRQFLNPSNFETPSSPEGSTSSFVESPSSNLLPPLQFGVPLAFLTQQQQQTPPAQQTGLSIENLFGLNNLSNPLQELLQRSVQLQQLAGDAAKPENATPFDGEGFEGSADNGFENSTENMTSFEAKNGTNFESLMKNGTNLDSLAKNGTTFEGLGKNATSFEGLAKNGTNLDSLTKNSTTLENLTKNATNFETLAKNLINLESLAKAANFDPQAGFDKASNFEAGFKPEEMPVLSAEGQNSDDSNPSSRSSPQAPNSTESVKSDDISQSQFDLMEKMFGASMMTLMQQLKSNPLPSVE
ncbi:unnamed protein product [Bursaphelenchus okinawaensis]|uniref:Homeobox domain-containing protein n=1 Tax=Bursaphelenchus okinawaensis TaxID=465554 RepID=A0A811JQQ3_9BILA|nr:unnamed protein product [Bursaphelenchus okinawaensis]CAG9078236.1 unnamed protein product [Bursaphelenchus okinawaensis]